MYPPVHMFYANPFVRTIFIAANFAKFFQKLRTKRAKSDHFELAFRRNEDYQWHDRAKKSFRFVRSFSDCKKQMFADSLMSLFCFKLFHSEVSKLTWMNKGEECVEQEANKKKND